MRYFAAQFQELVGQPPLQYLTRTRMAEASQLLRATDLRLAAIAGQVGYGSEPAFITAFKRHFGISPGAHRKGGQRKASTP
jgi:AraC-like DNA-binding protein